MMSLLQPALPLYSELSLARWTHCCSPFFFRAGTPSNPWQEYISMLCLQLNETSSRKQDYFASVPTLWIVLRNHIFVYTGSPWYISTTWLKFFPLLNLAKSAVGRHTQVWVYLTVWAPLTLSISLNLFHRRCRCVPAARCVLWLPPPSLESQTNSQRCLQKLHFPFSINLSDLVTLFLHRFM